MTARRRRLAALLGLAMSCGSIDAFAQSAATLGLDADPDRALWRAQSRLERGDIFLAQPLFEALYRSQRAEGGPLLAQVAQGLAICEIARGRAPAAVAPWLDALRLTQQGASLAQGTNLPALIDEPSGLAPLLAPIWLAGPELAPLVDDEFAQRFLAPSASQPAPTSELARLYRRAALFELGLPADGLDAAVAETTPTDDPLAPSLAFVRMIVESRAGEPGARAAARTLLESALREELETGPDSWREAWLRAALGRSLLRESEEASRNAGIIELMHLPARFSESQPRLAALALAEVARELSRRGELSVSGSVAALISGRLADPGAVRWLREPERSHDTSHDTPPATPPDPAPHAPPSDPQSNKEVPGS